MVKDNNEFSDAKVNTGPKATVMNLKQKLKPELNGESAFDYSGFMAIGGDMAITVQSHVSAMKKIIENKYDITPISDGWKYPIITYSKKIGNVVSL